MEWRTAMTDITELAQSWKTAAHKAKQANDLYLEGKITLSECVVETKDYLDYSDNPNNFLALVEALEKAQAKADVYDMLRDDYGLREKGVGLADFVDWQAKRIAELESRTVKMPEPFELAGLSGGSSYYHADEVDAVLIAAGIKVEAE
ncbi:TPA: ead/Ea22-like family protein [Klebsiella variicola subsp. variicola]